MHTCKDSCCLNHDNSISSEQIHREPPISSQVLPRNTILSVQQLNQNRFTLPRVTQNLQANEQEPINNLNNAQAEQGSRNEEEDNQIVNREHVEEREEEEQPEMILQKIWFLIWIMYKYIGVIWLQSHGKMM